MFSYRLQLCDFMFKIGGNFFGGACDDMTDTHGVANQNIRKSDKPGWHRAGNVPAPPIHRIKKGPKCYHLNQNTERIHVAN